MTEFALWRAVIAQAFGDARLEVPDAPVRPPFARKADGGEAWRKWSSHKNLAADRGEIIYNRDAALAWLLSGSSNSRDVCDYAGLDWAAVRDAARAEFVQDVIHVIAA